jgi:hypothetical protein
MKTIDFNSIRIHCSSLSKLMTEPKAKADKDAGNLSVTAKTHLIEVYARELFDFEKQLDNKYIRKGNSVEEEAINELSLMIRRPLEKNENNFINNFITGTPDVIYGGLCFDVKSSYDWLTFLSNISGELDPAYEAQMQGYLNLLGIKKGYIVYVLLDTPAEELEKQKYYLFTKGNYISEESPEFLRLWAEKEKNLIFSNHPIEERVLFFPVEADPEFIKAAEQKVIKARKFLQEFYETHKNFNESTIKSILSELKD